MSIIRTKNRALLALPLVDPELLSRQDGGFATYIARQNHIGLTRIKCRK